MYYIDIDIRENKVYLVPTTQIKGHEFMIICDNRYQAERLKLELNNAKIRNPINNDEFTLVSTVNKLGKTLSIFKRS